MRHDHETRRIDLAPGESKEVTFKLTPQDFAYCDVPGKQWKAEAGKYLIEVGGSSRDLPLKKTVALKKQWTRPITSIGAFNTSNTANTTSK